MEDIKAQIALVRREQEAFAEIIVATLCAYLLPERDPQILAQTLIAEAKANAAR